MAQYTPPAPATLKESQRRLGVSDQQLDREIDPLQFPEICGHIGDTTVFEIAFGLIRSDMAQVNNIKVLKGNLAGTIEMFQMWKKKVGRNATYRELLKIVYDVVKDAVLGEEILKICQGLSLPTDADSPNTDPPQAPQVQQLASTNTDPLQGQPLATSTALHEEQPLAGISTSSQDLSASSRAAPNFAYNFLNISKIPETGNGVLVAVVDTGINSSHKTFQAPQKIVANKNFIQEGKDDGSHTDTNYYHGTGVAGVVAGKHLGKGRYALSPEVKRQYPNCEKLQIGVAENAQLVICRVAETKDYFNPTAVARAINWIYEHNQSVINLKKDTSDKRTEGHQKTCTLLHDSEEKLIRIQEHLKTCTLLHDSEEKLIRIVVISARLADNNRGVKEAIEKLNVKAKPGVLCAKPGVLCVAGVGNDGYKQESGWPAKYPSVLSVGSCSPFLTRSPFSTELDNGADVYTIGENILLPKDGDEGLWTQDGTSFAAPAIAGLVAVLIQKAREEYKELKSEQKEQLLSDAYKMLTSKELLIKFFHNHMKYTELAMGKVVSYREYRVLGKIVCPEIFWNSGKKLLDIAKTI